MILTIITPVFNGSDYLESCVENVADQWAEGIEHLIIDGGSSDGSIQILENLEKQFPHLRWISEKDEGQSDAMNKGIRMAKGNWISFLNVDDFYEPGILPKILEKIVKTKNNNCLLVGNLNIWNENGQLLSVNKPSGMSIGLLLADICDWPVNPSSYFYPVSIHEILGGFPKDEHFAMDYDFIIKLMMAGIPVHYYDEIWGNFRLLPQAKTRSDQAKNSSYLRADSIRNKYFQFAPPGIRLQVWLLKKVWAIRNKLFSLIHSKTPKD